MLHSVYLFLNIGTGELMLIFFIALLLFGGEKLPGMARTLGRGIRDFKNASEDVKREINNQINSFDEKNEKKKDPVQTQIEDRYNETPVTDAPEDVSIDNTPEAAAETPAAEYQENLNDSNNVDAVTPGGETAENASEVKEKKPVFTKPDNTIEYKS